MEELKDIPINYIRTNQVILAVLTLSSIVLQNGWLLLVTFFFVITPLIIGSKGNISFYIAKRMFPKINGEKTEAAELQRFNQTIAATLLTIALLVYFLTASWIAWLFVGMVFAAVTVALMGYCVGCFFYFQWKKFKYNLKNN